jgi:hypothetical protein
VGRQQHNRYYHFITPTPAEVKITRRHHPLLGQAFEVLQGGPRNLVLRAADGFVMKVPRTWTDADGAKERDDDESESFFTVDAIRELSELTEALGRRSPALNPE